MSGSGNGTDGNGNPNSASALGALGGLLNGQGGAAQPAPTAPPANHPLVDKAIALATRNGQSFTPLMVAALNEQVQTATDAERYALDTNLTAALAAPPPPPDVLRQAAAQAAAAQAAHMQQMQAQQAQAQQAQAPQAQTQATQTHQVSFLPPELAPAPAAAPAPAVATPAQDVIPFPRTPGLVPVGSAMYRLTHEAIRASAFTAVVNGQPETRYRPIAGGLMAKRGGERTNNELLYMIKLTQPALLSDAAGKIVEVPPGRTGIVQIQGVFGTHGLALLERFIDLVNGQYPFVEVECMGFVHGLDGKEEAVFDTRTLPGDKPGADGSATIKRISAETLGLRAPQPTTANGAAAGPST